MKVRSIGWLAFWLFPWQKRRVSPVVIEALTYFSTVYYRYDGTLGEHVCGFCKSYSSNSEFFIDLNGVRYKMPIMILHYIEDHGYSPPRFFCQQLEEFFVKNKDQLLSENPNLESRVPEIDLEYLDEPDGFIKPWY